MTRDLLFSFLCALVVDAIQISDPFLQGATRKDAFRQLVARDNMTGNAITIQTRCLKMKINMRLYYL